mgnify:CR=1 FL=1
MIFNQKADIRKRLNISTNRPSKLLMWYLCDIILGRYNRIGTVLDLACGRMNWRPAFQCSKYIGVDLDVERIRIGKERFPDSEGIVAEIPDDIKNIKADFVVCLETIGINNKFEKDTLITVEALIQNTAANGSLLFNIGYDAACMHSEILECLIKKFTSVEYYEYGRWSKPFLKPLTPPLAKLMYAFPGYRRPRNKDPTFFLYHAQASRL